MRSSLFTLSLLLLNVPLVYGNTQYSEGACMLLEQQIQRFSQQPQNSNYRNAKREYDRHCRNPVVTVPRETTTFSDIALVKPAAAQPARSDITKAAALRSREPVSQALNNKALNKALAKPALEKGADDTELMPPAALPVAMKIAAVTVQPVAAIAEISTVAVSPPIIADSQIVPKDLLLPILNTLPLIAASIFALLLAVFLLTSWFGLNLPGFKGVFAEYKLNRLLRWRLARSYHHFRKLKLQTARDETVVVDHLVLSPFGIFVIMVTDYRGRIFGSEAEANWTRQYFGNTKQFMNPLHQNFKNTAAVKHLLQLQDTNGTKQVHSVIAFSRVGQFQTTMPANVTYVDTTAAYLKQFNEPCFNDEQLNRYAALLRQASTDN